MSLAFVHCFRKDAFPKRGPKVSHNHHTKKLTLTAAANSQTEQRTLAAPITATEVPAKTSSAYPMQFQSVVIGRSKRALGNQFGLQNFGVNHTTLAPGASSALQHYHSKQDEFVYILEGTATLRFGDKEMEMNAGTCMGFPVGQKVGHCIVNRSNEDVVYLEIGDRTAGDTVEYPEVDLKAFEENGKWSFTRKDGTLYQN